MSYSQTGRSVNSSDFFGFTKKIVCFNYVSVLLCIDYQCFIV
nr:MAG TPA: hypothetical protein [Caudoviricetes sp.]